MIRLGQVPGFGGPDAAGREPGPQSLHADIGRQQAGRYHGTAERFASHAWPPSGHANQVPRPTRQLIGRELEVGRIKTWITRNRPYDQAAPIVLVDGPPGSGRASVARALAAELAAELPRPALWARLGEEEPRHRQPEEQLRRWLLELGWQPSELPGGLDALAACYRERLAGTDAVVVVEEVTGPDEVELLRPPPGCAMMVTSRTAFPAAGVSRIRRLALRPLGALDALKLLSGRAGWAWLAADPVAARAILRCCEQLPLALVIAGAALAGPGGKVPVGEFAGRLVAETERLGGDGLTAALSLADQRLSMLQAQALRALGLLDLPTVEPEAVAAMLFVERSEAGDLLEELAEAGLVEGDGRPYRLHDLVRGFARAAALRVGTAAERRAVLRRAVMAYRDKAEAAAVLLSTRAVGSAARPSSLGTAPPSAARGAESGGHAGARGWADAERANLLRLLEAAMRESLTPGSASRPSEDTTGPAHPDARDMRPGGEREAGNPTGHDHGERVAPLAGATGPARDRDRADPGARRAGQAPTPPDDSRVQLAAAAARLAAATDRVLVSLGAEPDLDRCRELGLAAAREAGEHRLQAWFAHRIGTGHADADRHEAASRFFEQAIAIAEGTGDEDMAVLARFDLAYARCKLHQFEDAQPLLEALLADGAADPELNDLTRANLGYVYRHLGRHAEARSLLEESLRGAKRRRDSRLAAFAQRNLTKLEWSPGDVPHEDGAPPPATGPMPAVQAFFPTGLPPHGPEFAAAGPAAQTGIDGVDTADDLPLDGLAAVDTALDRLSRGALAASARGQDPAARATLERLGSAVTEVRPVVSRVTEALLALSPGAPAALGRWRRVRRLCVTLVDLRPYIDRLGDSIAAATGQPAPSPAELGALAASSEALRMKLDELRAAVRALTPSHAALASQDQPSTEHQPAPMPAPMYMHDPAKRP